MRSLIVVFLGLTTAGCLPVLAGGMIWKSSKSRQAHQQWSEQFQRSQDARAAQGLKPLDWCIEAVHFDKGWAHEDPACGLRIDGAEAGDSLALAYPGLVH